MSRTAFIRLAGSFHNSSRYIRTPLATWVDMPNRPAPIPVALVMLLDALDEADQDDRG